MYLCRLNIYPILNYAASKQAWFTIIQNKLGSVSTLLRVMHLSSSKIGLKKQDMTIHPDRASRLYSAQKAWKRIQ